MSAAIHTLHGNTAPGEPVADVVADLEMLLAQAKTGNIRAVAYSAVKAGGSASTGWAGDGGTIHDLGAGIGYLFHRFFSAMDG